VKRVKLTRETQLALDKLRNKQKQFMLSRERALLEEIAETDTSYDSRFRGGLERVLPAGSTAKYKTLCTCGHPESEHYARTKWGALRPCLKLTPTTESYDCECRDFVSQAKPKDKAVAPQAMTPRAKLVSLGRRKIDL
jgi:hypothetical protein